LFCFISRPTFDPVTAAAKKKSKKAAAAVPEEKASEDNTKFLGCVGSESAFIDKVYSGGSTGANHGLALHHAKTSKKRYFAIARGGGDGHSFAFSQLDASKGFINNGGCERPCADLEDKVCGCMDGACTGPVPKGEEHNRRWAVYEVLKK
jgi:hypothetical protein